MPFDFWDEPCQQLSFLSFLLFFRPDFLFAEVALFQCVTTATIAIVHDEQFVRWFVVTDYEQQP